jgi:hypothetical protein
VMSSGAGMGSGVAGAAAGLGAIAAIAAFKAKPKADTRQWSSLPDAVHVRTFSSKKQTQSVATVRFLAGDVPGAQPDRPLKFEADPRGARYAMIRSH